MCLGDQTRCLLVHHNSVPFSAKYNGNTYYYVYDIYGNVKYLYDAAGNLALEYAYRDPWGGAASYTVGTSGNTTAHTQIAELNPFRYKGYYHDADLQMYYCSSRYYDPEIGRWINADGYVSTGQGIVGNNMYGYCNNSPVVHSDRSGTRMVRETPGESILQLLDGVDESLYNYVLGIQRDVQVPPPKPLPQIPSKEERDMAALLVGEAGDTSTPEWKENMQAVAHLLINLSNDSRFENISTPHEAALSSRFTGYEGGLNRIGDPEYAIVWDYAYELAGYLKNGDYASIPCPEGITEKHISMYYAPKFNPTQCSYYYSALDVVTIGDNVFYAEEW